MQSTTYNGIEYRFYDHLYAVSKDGDILRKLEPYTPTKHNFGYLSAGRQRLVHRMIATCWLVKPANANHVHHKNHDKTDNRADNLEWVTPKLHMGVYHRGHLGKYERTAEIREKIRNSRLGTKTSEATKQKQREASFRLGCKPPPRKAGTKCSAESIQKMRENNHNTVGCNVNGIAYRSFSSAGRALGEKPHSLRKRCLSNNFPDYTINDQ